MNLALDSAPFVAGYGPSDAEILIVGEAPGKDEAAQGQPFVGNAGVEMTRMLQQVGILRS